jgi:hypothetical protein
VPQAYAAGLAEGYLTWALIESLWSNLRPVLFPINDEGEGTLSAALDFMHQQREWTERHLTYHPDGVSSQESRELAAISSAMTQFEGLWEGYIKGVEAARRPPELGREELYLLNALGDTAIGLVPMARAGG